MGKCVNHYYEEKQAMTAQESLSMWIDPNDKTQKQYLPHIGERVLFKHSGCVYLGKHTGGSFKAEYPLGKCFGTWDCLWMYTDALDAQPVARTPLSDEQLSKALDAGGIETQTHIGILNREHWTTCGSMDPRKICRAIEAAHGITKEKRG